MRVSDFASVMPAFHVRDHQVELAVARDVARVAAHRAGAADVILLRDQRELVLAIGRADEACVRALQEDPHR